MTLRNTGNIGNFFLHTFQLSLTFKKGLKKAYIKKWNREKKTNKCPSRYFSHRHLCQWPIHMTSCELDSRLMEMFVAFSVLSIFLTKIRKEWHRGVGWWGKRSTNIWISHCRNMTKTLMWLSTCLEILLAMALVYLCDFGLIAPHSEHACYKSFQRFNLTLHKHNYRRNI